MRKNHKSKPNILDVAHSVTASAWTETQRSSVPLTFLSPSFDSGGRPFNRQFLPTCPGFPRILAILAISCPSPPGSSPKNKDLADSTPGLTPSIPPHCGSEPKHYMFCNMM